MKKILVSILTLALFSCAENDPEEQLKNLNGYWEIKSVDSPYGNDRHYKFNERVDYIELKDTIGFRTKVLPRIDGTFVKSDTKETVIARITNDSLRLNYSTPFDNWTETVLKADGNQLQVKNNRGMIYTYSKFEKINYLETSSRDIR
ncbi:hypothetical protein DSM03_102366 [Leeuwenhoekiella aestuarii]|uniref:Lipocalin-like domain-containing protein n=1 Tax=Leeuwenhoekiella aestuarii TaxID=2249426 RepID=A0A4Q0NV17_9FLAO|nr:hypothetical protein [Leeuwenhoekiella aestuarii]RXG15404.1 hypothetical protein DSM04_103292 [Leeuwenhoekiella aestuarii]RXG17489.1 hypothetical protein DSM03_102366 [Leeuwenhoekiella aestuarii]